MSIEVKEERTEKFFMELRLREERRSVSVWIEHTSKVLFFESEFPKKTNSPANFLEFPRIFLH